MVSTLPRVRPSCNIPDPTPLRSRRFVEALAVLVENVVRTEPGGRVSFAQLEKDLQEIHTPDLKAAIELAVEKGRIRFAIDFVRSKVVLEHPGTIACVAELERLEEEDSERKS